MLVPSALPQNGLEDSLSELRTQQSEVQSCNHFLSSITDLHLQSQGKQLSAALQTAHKLRICSDVLSAACARFWSAYPVPLRSLLTSHPVADKMRAKWRKKRVRRLKRKRRKTRARS